MRVVIEWGGEKFSAETFDDLLDKFLKDPWFGTLEEFAKRIFKIHGVDISLQTATKIFDQLNRLGEIKILER